MADGTVKVTEGTDKFLDMESLTVGANTVYRERVQISGTGATDLAPVDATAGLKVNLGADNDVTVTGSVTANAGTNLNTSALALEATLSTLNGKVTAVDTGAVVVASSALPAGASTLAEQQTQTTALQIIDDWDESDRAKVNPIVGQAGVQGGAGAVSATTQRIAIATDANAVTAVGTVADDATTPGAPVMVGGTAKSPDGTDPGNVSAENDVARTITDLNRRVYVNTNHPRSLHKHLNGSSAYTDESIAADPGDGFQIVITSIIASTGAATALNFFLEEGSTTIFGPIYLEAVAGRGFASGPIYLPVTPSTAVTLTSSAAIAQSYDIDYYIQAV